MSLYRKAALSAAFFLLLGPILGGCSVQPWLSPREKALRIATKAGLELKQVASSKFSLTTFQTANRLHSDTLTVYIEGDGAPWFSSTRPPNDPTPLNPVSLILASRDGRHPMLYVARPCQYLDEDKLASCDYKYWTAGRYSPEVIEAVDEVISKVRISTGTKRVRLLGFSGGGVVAALVAARRGDIDSLVTVAAPLDIAAWSAFHQISPLLDSLNPMDFSRELSRIRQAHLVGEKDTIVPPEYSKAISKKMPLARYVIVANYTHECCWEEYWPELMLKELR